MAARNGAGTYVRSFDWTDDAANSVPITASRFDTEMDGMASELTNSVAADGQTTMSGTLKMGGFKITNVATAVAATDAPTLTQTETLIQALYPVGTIYYNKSDSTNPGTLLGFGTWVAITDKFIVSRGGTYTSTGGAATVSLSSANNGPHTHTQQGGSTITNPMTGVFENATLASLQGTNTTSSSGSGSAFSIIPPYQAVYTWERTV